MRVLLVVAFTIIVLALGILELLASQLTAEPLSAPGRPAPVWLAR